MITISGLPASAQIPATTPNKGTSTNISFAQQLASALTSILGSSVSDAHIEIDTNSAQGSAVISISPGQAAATAGTSLSAGGSAGPNSLAVNSAQLGSAAAFVASASNPPVSHSFTASTGTTPVGPAANQPVDSTDAYWAQFPPEVQNLRSIQDPTAREAEANRLAGKGYTIDYLTMVWGWQPLQAMRIRQDAGYTWVPALGQPAVQTPGVHFPGIADYNPASPPPGSIKVSTDFAKGTFIDPLYFSDAAAIAKELGGTTTRPTAV